MPGKPFERSHPSERPIAEPLVMRESAGDPFPGLTHPAAASPSSPAGPVDVIWYLGTSELVEQICWRLCRTCEVYWIGQPRCWLCGEPSGSGFPRLEAVAAQNPIGEDGDLLD